MKRAAGATAAGLLLLYSIVACSAATNASSLTELSKERLVFQTQYGDIHMAFYSSAAPKTVEHIRRCGELGLYNTNYFFRVDKGFVAQTAEINGGRTAPMSALQQEVANQRVPLEVNPAVKHNKRGILSMARGDDPNSGGSSFSILLGPAPHLDMNYAIFGEASRVMQYVHASLDATTQPARAMCSQMVTQGLETLSKFEELPTKREGIFVMPLERITILSTYTYVVDNSPATRLGDGGGQKLCSDALASLQARFDAQSAQLERIRKQQLPG